jgi:predicted dehydrogenase
MATTLPDARRVLEAWRVSGKIAMIGFNYRHRADYEDARRLVAQGAIGAIKMTDVRFTTRAGQAKGWRDRGSPGGGVLLDLASHEFDRMELVGSLGKISIDRYAAVSVARRGPSPVGPFAKCVSAFGQLGNFGRMYARRKETWNEASFREAVSQFVFGVIHQEQPQPDLHAGLASLGVVVAAQQSLATGKPVDVSVDNPLSS